MSQSAILETLRQVAPSVAFTIEWEHDEYEEWDGDGPSPAEGGYIPFYVKVTAHIIHNGQFMTGADALGGCWMLDSEPVDDIHGYLPDMLLMAIENLVIRLGSMDTTVILAQLGDASAAIRE